MASVQEELFSFIGKFTQLCSYGIKANLQCINSSDGISLNLHADIGFIHPPYADHHRSNNNVAPSQAQHRRRRRRRQARLNKEICAHEHKINNDLVGENVLLESFPDSSNSEDVCDYGSGPDLLTDTDARTSIHAAEPVSMPPCSDLEKYDTQYYEFGDGVLDLILEQPTTDLPFETAETYPSSSSPSPLLHDRPSTTLRDPMNQKEFLTYMENFATSLGTILEKKLADVIGT